MATRPAISLPTATGQGTGSPSRQQMLSVNRHPDSYLAELRRALLCLKRLRKMVRGARLAASFCAGMMAWAAFKSSDRDCWVDVRLATRGSGVWDQSTNRCRYALLVRV